MHKCIKLLQQTEAIVASDPPSTIDALPRQIAAAQSSNIERQTLVWKGREEK
jgi:hypothetical protein